MSENLDFVPLSLAQRVDQICVRFEDACIAGQRPRIEDYLSDGPEPAVLLGELLKVELEYRRRSGETPTSEEYRVRFPEHVGLTGRC